MNHDLAALAREVQQMRHEIVTKLLRRDLLMPYELPDAAWLDSAFQHCDDKWPAVAALVRELGEQEVTC